MNNGGTIASLNAFVERASDRLGDVTGNRGGFRWSMDVSYPNGTNSVCLPVNIRYSVGPAYEQTVTIRTQLLHNPPPAPQERPPTLG